MLIYWNTKNNSIAPKFHYFSLAHVQEYKVTASQETLNTTNFWLLFPWSCAAIPFPEPLNKHIVAGHYVGRLRKWIMELNI